MTRIILDKEGQIPLPESFRNQHPLEPGTEMLLESSERGLSLYFVRPDVQRAYIEITSRCNLSCAMCVRQSWLDPLGRMSARTFQAVLHGLQAFPELKQVYFGGFGEPLLHPNLVNMVAQVHALGVDVTITTNGLLLNRRRAEALFKAGVDTLVISLDSVHVQAYHNKPGSNGRDQVLKNIQGVHQLIRDAGWRLPALGLEYVLTRSNQADLYQLPDLARQVGAAFIIVTNLLPHTPELAGEIVYDRDEPLRLGGGWGINRAGWIAWGTPRLPRMKWGAARQCRFVHESSLVIGWDGAVSPCSALMHSYHYYIYGRHKQVGRYVLGSVNDRSLAEIWTS